MVSLDGVLLWAKCIKLTYDFVSRKGKSRAEVVMLVIVSGSNRVKEEDKTCP